ncbi:MAG: 1-deoxy-D-xylulose-5-phosphate reductoisomerase [Hyphomicrobiaceae bacterium]
MLAGRAEGVAATAAAAVDDAIVNDAATRRSLRGPRRISVLGATGSIGLNTLDLVGRAPECYEVVALTANRNWAGLAELALRHRAGLAVVADETVYADLKAALSGSGIAVAAGAEAVAEAAASSADWIMAAIVGAAGLRPTLEAVRQGTRLALANKECLVAAGDLFMAEIGRRGTELLPVDSEHSAAFQAIAGSPPETIEQIVLTASGGPFRRASLAELERATPEAALRHPNWQMGRKVTIDSATLMNKGLELIEAYHLFPVEAGQLGVLVHPQSIVHSLVSFRDGSVLAQLGMPDMRTPIALSLAWPDRMATPTERLDLARIATLTFEAPDEARFRCLALARAALHRGSAACTVLNAANEIAVEAFLERQIGFLAIARLVEATLERAEASGLIRDAADLDDVLARDAAARGLATSLLAAVAG